MIKTLVSVRRKLVRTKLYYQRALGYISIVNSAMLLFLLLSNLEKYGIDLDIKQLFFPILIFGVLAMILFGYFEDKWGFLREETHFVSKRNPDMQEILDRLERIEKKL